MMIHSILSILTLILPTLLSTAYAAGAQQQLYDIAAGKRIRLEAVVSDFKKSRIILVGEHHTNAAHHEIQLAVIRELHAGGAKVAVGMEMFRSDSNADLAAWTAGKISEDDFISIFNDNWNYAWAMYAPILRYGRKNELPVKGLNISSAVTRQVARSGFKSLTKAQRGELDDVTCRVDKIYMDFIQRAYGAHAHGDLDFTHFCEAQLVWDNMMAIHALDFIAAHPDHIIVIVTGVGHAWKGGIPARIAARSQVPVTVVLPEIRGVTEPDTVDTQDADYIFLQ